MDEHYDEDELSLADSQEGLGGSPGHRGGASSDSASMGGQSSPVAPAFRGRGSTGTFQSFLLSAALAELVGTFFLIFLGISSLYASSLVGNDALSTGSLLIVAIGYGFAYGCLVYCFSLNGGGYIPSIRQMNPALTMSLYLLKKIDGVKAIVLIVAQLIGAITGTGILFLCFKKSLPVFELFDATNIWQQLMMSIMTSFLFFFVILITNFGVTQPVLQQGVSTDSSEQAPQSVHELNSLISALVAVLGAGIGTPLTGCFMNPLFGLTVLALSNWYNSVIVVIFGPVLGALLATLTAKLFTYRTRAPFLAGVRWGTGGMGGLGLGAHPMAQQMAAMSAQGGGSGGRQVNPFNPNSEEKQGSRF
jgi:aquaporin Z